ncbi:MAG: hypothetical protein M3256_25895 [Actinomycetota bacterium]|nr:hypothetical protein [Actinomycetota bacterium]
MLRLASAALSGHAWGAQPAPCPRPTRSHRSPAGLWPRPRHDSTSTFVDHAFDRRAPPQGEVDLVDLPQQAIDRQGRLDVDLADQYCFNRRTPHQLDMDLAGLRPSISTQTNSMSTPSTFPSTRALTVRDEPTLQFDDLASPT